MIISTFLTKMSWIYEKDFIIKLISLVVKKSIPILSIIIFYKFIEHLSREINIREYEYDGDFHAHRIKIKCLNMDRNIDGHKNNYIRFAVFIQRFVSPTNGNINMTLSQDIDIKNKSTYSDRYTIPINKNNLTNSDRVKIIKWLYNETKRQKIATKYNLQIVDKKLPNFLFDEYLKHDSILLNY